MSRRRVDAEEPVDAVTAVDVVDAANVMAARRAVDAPRPMVPARKMVTARPSLMRGVEILTGTSIGPAGPTSFRTARAALAARLRLHLPTDEELCRSALAEIAKLERRSF